ncbi:GNAT family N-acetyltransferase [Agrobacterium larrymoorei]|uniref:GNAT family N-acetyltransferase n=1 Tax=Agrobacterium larrymoorei TaxID=160699 RepID=A0AAF0KD62_9HYPH|nr:GNAT family N-acetyltransferase [Agrobacterium larrymoorei]QYA08328.1 GNAT family N-acetyltransferase [Agrobacterium larrymoorei]WHA40870.1 GNAT family N-acetyltransferase [Agrobacterium larrymoorei]
MADISVHSYRSENKLEWNDWISSSKNGTFLHNRDFMDYHADRFHDASIMVRQDGVLIAVLPANSAEGAIFSHGGLTYGGVVTGSKMRIEIFLKTFNAILEFYREQDAKRLYYKPVPHIYQTQPADEDLYALFRHNARLIRCDLSSAIPLARRLKPSKSRKQAVALAKKANLVVRQSRDWQAYWNILSEVLAHRHEASPTHSLREIEMLARSFPDEISLFGAFENDKMVAGLVIFDCGRTVHVQYIAASARGREIGSVDFIVSYLMENIFMGRDWFDFGISTTSQGRQLNEGLALQKEMFGARSVVYQQFEIDLA